ncbi:MAG: transporter [Bacteroidales bacterium]|nr:transporter [Bacteroidales bacterium]
MHRAVQFFKDWMLPLAIVTGISLYLFYYFTPFLKPWGGTLHVVASEGQRLVIALLLFFQFVQITPRDLKLRRWHLWALLFQALSFGMFAALSAILPEGGALRILAEAMMICLICPTAAAAGVITRKLDGDLAATVGYLCLTNLAATFLIPMVIPMIRPAADLGFWTYVLRIALKVFPILVLPGLLAWLVRYTMPGLQRSLERFAPNSFYIWFFGLTLAMVLATHALLKNYPGALALGGIVAVSLASCFVQFYAGRRIGKGRIASITAGQALGQKNTGFLIWLGYNYLTPVTSVAGGLYAIWQNLFNSWELYEHKK